MINGKIADQTVLENTRRRFERYNCQRTKNNLGFDQYLELFSQGCNTLTQIAAITGTGKDVIHRMYNRYFKELCHGKSGMDRRKICTLKKQSLSRQASLTEDCLAVIERAQKAGCQVKKILNWNKTKYLNDRLVINSKLCRISSVSNQKNPAHNKTGFYSVVFIKLNRHNLPDYQYIIVNRRGLYGQKEYFIIPITAIKKANRGSEDISLNIPLNPASSPAHIPARINFWHYQDAWHLIV